MNDIIRNIKGEESYKDNIMEFINRPELYPSIEISSDLHDIFLLDHIDDKYREKKFTGYSYKTINIPRVTHILDQCINKEFLIYWALKLGKERYSYEKHRTLDIGTRTHEMIESFLFDGKYPKEILTKCKPSIKESVKVGFANFQAWLDNLAKRGFFLSSVVATEKELLCPYFGGTADCICRINGKVYLVDFKTSKKISPEYILQTSAYTWIINSGYVPNMPKIDGIGIIRVDKNITNSFDELFLNFSIPEHNIIYNNYVQAFGYMLRWYYEYLNIEAGFNYVKDQAKETFKPIKEEN